MKEEGLRWDGQNGLFEATRESYVNSQGQRRFEQKQSEINLLRG